MSVVAIVDDTPDVREMVRVLLERAGLTVGAEASSVEEAVGLIHASADGVIVLDHHLEGEVLGLDGATLLKARSPMVKVVLFSAMDLESEVRNNPSVDAFIRKDRVLELPGVVRALLSGRSGSDLPSIDGEEFAARQRTVSPRDLLLARWLATPSLLFGTLPPPVEASEVIRHLIEPTPDRADTVLRFVASSGDIDVAVGHLLALRRLIEAEPDSRIQIDVELLDLLIVEVTSNVIAAARRAAMIDPLTGVGNRRALELELEPAIARSERSRRPLAVVYIDLIGLKAVNDRHGHEEGDRALTSFTRALELVKRTGDMGYRVGGDEFVVLLPDTCTRDAERFTSRLASTGAPPFSTGIANTEDDGFDPRRLVRLADVRMLQTRYRTAAESDHAGVSLSS